MIDLEGIGLTLDDLDLNYDDDLPPLSLDRPRYQPKGWWTLTVLEDFHLGLPSFQSGSERAHYMVARMGRAALANLNGATADDPVFEFGGSAASLNDLLARIYRDAVNDALDLSRD